MLDEKDLQAIAALIDKKLEPITTRLDKLEEGQTAITTRLDEIQEDIDFLKEETTVTRGALNHLIEWSDKVSDAVDFPLPKS